jgi:hypothetical protein
MHLRKGLDDLWHFLLLLCFASGCCFLNLLSFLFCLFYFYFEPLMHLRKGSDGFCGLPGFLTGQKGFFELPITWLQLGLFLILLLLFLWLFAVVVLLVIVVICWCFVYFMYILSPNCQSWPGLNGSQELTERSVNQCMH